MAFITTNEARTLLQLGSGSDALIDVLIPIVQSHIIYHCNNDFMSGSIDAFIGYTDAYYFENYDDGYVDTSVTQSFPDGLKLAAAEMINYHLQNKNNNSKSSETIGAYSVTYNNQYPETILDLLKPYSKITFI